MTMPIMIGVVALPVRPARYVERVVAMMAKFELTAELEAMKASLEAGPAQAAPSREAGGASPAAPASPASPGNSTPQRGAAASPPPVPVGTSACARWLPRVEARASVPVPVPVSVCPCMCAHRRCARKHLTVFTPPPRCRHAPQDQPQSRQRRP